jgi:TrmH family RNA methyltransferase
MPEPKVITSLANPRVKRVMKLRKPRERRAAGVVLAEGEREVSRAVNAGLVVHEVWVCRGLLEKRFGEIPPFVATLLRDGRFEVFDTDEKVFGKLTYRDDPEGVLAVVRAPGWTLADPPDVSADALVLVAVGTEKPGNLGAMVRTADAAGCACVLAPHGESAAGAVVDLYNPNAIRASTGAIFSMPTVACDDAEAIAFLKQRGLRLAATTPDAGTPYTQADLTGPLALVIGPEDTGLSPAWLDAAELRLHIPMHARTADSLNASNAAAILLFEALRQRG